MNPSTHIRVLVGLLAVGLLTLLPYPSAAQGAVASTAITKGPHFESAVAGRPRVIIFVHGFTGDSTATWLNDNGAYFPRLVATDPTIKQADVFVASYSTHWTKETSTIESLADGLFNQLNEFHVITDHMDLVFVCHSLGGLIVERMLIKRPEISSKTSFIQFFGTPHEGAFDETKNPIFAFLGAFGPNSIIPELRYGSGNKVLVQLDTDWRNRHLSSIHRLCALESFDFHGLSSVGKVVPYFSGSYGCDSGVPVESILGDHMSMVKPAHRSGDPNQAYLVFLRNYREFPYYDTRTINDNSHDFRLYLQVDCERTTSETNRQVVFDLNPFFKEELIGTPVGTLVDTDHIKGANPPTVHKTGPRTVEVTYGFNGEDKNLGSCPGGGHATLVVHPIILSHVPVPDGEPEPPSQ